MKKSRNFFGLLLGFIMIFTALFTGCGGKGDAKLTVTFDYNYEGAPAAYVVEIVPDSAAEPPESPTRKNYEFTKWYKDKECNQLADFEYAITEDTTFYAGWKKIAATVYFDLAYEGGTILQEDVTLGGKASQPEEPERDGYLFEGWYLDETGTKIFDFDTTINEDITVYAKWEEFSGEAITVTYLYNYEGAEQYYKTKMRKDRKPSKPGDPKREGYYFGGWYEEAECKTIFDFSERLSESTTLYARWLQTYTFEAEYTDLNGKNGSGYSGETSGVDLICNDRGGKLGETVGEAGASNGCYVASLYQNGLSIDFVINSSADTSDAVMELRLSVEYFDKVLNPSLYRIEVNGEDVIYPEIKLDNAVPESQVSSKGIRPFENYFITASLKLKAGENIIKLIVSNDIDRGGTMAADAPAIDCMYIHTDATLNWTPKEENLIGRI